MFFAPSFSSSNPISSSRTFNIHGAIHPPATTPHSAPLNENPRTAPQIAAPANARPLIPATSAAAVTGLFTDTPHPIPDGDPVPYRSIEGSAVSAYHSQQSAPRTARAIPIYQINARPSLSLSLSLPDHSPPAYFTSSPPKYAPIPATEETALLIGPGLRAYCPTCDVEGATRGYCRCADRTADWIVRILVVLNLLIWSAVFWGYFASWIDGGNIDWGCGGYPMIGGGYGAVYPHCGDRPVGGGDANFWNGDCIGEDCPLGLVGG